MVTRIIRYYVVCGDEAGLKQMFFVFIENGTKYSDLNISFSSNRLKNNTVIDIINLGIDVSKKDIPYIFDWFFSKET